MINFTLSFEELPVVALIMERGTMIKQLAVISMAAAFSTACYGRSPEWMLLGGTSEFDFYYDAANVTVSGKDTSILTLYDMKKPTSNFPNEVHQSGSEHVFMDCAKRTYVLHDLTFYQGHMAAGEVVRVIRDPDQSRVFETSSGTPIDILADKLCTPK